MPAPRLTQQEFIRRSQLIFKDLDYSKVVYINNRTHITLICKQHGEFYITPNAHLAKRGCKFCANFKNDLKSFLEKARLIHGDKFDYSKSIYLTSKDKIIIICHKHGEFLQTPDKHLNNKQGCPKCKKSSHKNLEYIITNSNIIHNNFYNYEKSVFTKMSQDIIIECPIHGEFKQTPANHINNKQGCSSCTVSTSKAETAWLDSLSLPNDNKHRSVSLYTSKRKYIVDGFDPVTNTVYEFYGDYWHGNPNRFDPKAINPHTKISFEEMYQKTLNREKELLNAGYQLITCWESNSKKIKKP